MKAGRFGFGLFVLLVGIVWLAYALGWHPTGWAALLPYWPVILILWGLALMTKQPFVRGFALAAAAVLAAVLLVAWQAPTTGTVMTSRGQSLNVPAAADVSAGQLRFDSGAGRFTIKDGSDLVNVEATTLVGQYHLTNSTFDGVATARVWFDQGGWRSHQGMMGGWRNEATVTLGRDVAWRIDANVGAADFTLDATNLKLDEASVSAGAAQLTVIVGDLQPKAVVTVKAGASNLVIRVPQAAGVRATLATGLTGKNLADLTKISDKVWQSADYETAIDKIDLNLETGASNIQLTRY